MRFLGMVLLMVVMLAAGCIGDGSANTTKTRSSTTTRSYNVDCGEAQEIGNGSCGLTVTSIGILGGGGQ